MIWNKVRPGSPKFGFVVILLSLALLPACRKGGDTSDAAGGVSGARDGGATARLTGFWESGRKSPGGLGSGLLMHGDGTLLFTVGSITDARYRTDGTALSIMDSTSTRTFQFRVDGDTLYRTPAGSRDTQMLVRSGSPTEDGGLQGRWIASQGSDVRVEEYEPDGRWHLRVPVKSMVGSFVAIADTLTMDIEGGRTAVYVFSVEADSLSLVNPSDGSIQKFARRNPWFDAVELGYVASQDSIVFRFDPRQYQYASDLETMRWVPLDTIEIVTVHVTGEFNDWSAFDTPMKRNGAVFSASVPRHLVGPGRNLFRFVVNGGYRVEAPVQALNAAPVEARHKDVSRNLVVRLD